MGVVSNAITIVSSENGKQIGNNLWDTFTSALSGDKKAWVGLLKDIGNLPMSAKTILFYNNFQQFINGMGSDPDTNQKFQEFLNSEGKRKENSQRIIQIIDEMDSDFKINTLINLTKSASYGFISKREYFKLGKLIESLIVEDLEYLQLNIISGQVSEMDLTDEYVQNGLMYITEEGDYAYSLLAFKLDKFALSFGNEKYKYNGTADYIPKVFPEKQGIITTLPSDSIQSMFENDI